MEEVKEIRYVYNVDEIIMKKGVVFRIVLMDDSVKWTSLTGNEISEYLSQALEERYGVIKN